MSLVLLRFDNIRFIKPLVDPILHGNTNKSWARKRQH